LNISLALRKGKREFTSPLAPLQGTGEGKIAPVEKVDN